MLESISAFDLRVYKYVNEHLTSAWLDPIMLFISSNVFWSCLLLGAGLVSMFRRDIFILKILFAITMAVGVSDGLNTHVLKPGFERVRPCHWNIVRRVEGICGSKYGMPSNHASNGMAAATVLASFAGPPWWAIGLGAVALVGYSRVYLAVHFPGDVFVGIFVGWCVGLAVVWATRRWLKPNRRNV